MKRKMIILLTILSIFSFTMVAYAKYVSNTTVTNENAKASLYILKESIDTLSLNILGEDIKPNSSYSYNFEINNFNGAKRTETMIDYTIKIDNSNNLPLEFELYKNSTKLELTNQKTSIQTLQVNTNQTDSYELKIKFKDTVNNYEYADLLEYIDIIIESNQRV